MAAANTGIISGAMGQTDPNAPQSGAEAAATGVGQPAQAPAPLGAPATSSNITTASSPSTYPSSSGSSAASYYNQLNGSTPSPAPNPAPTPAPTMAPPSTGIIRVAMSQNQKNQSAPAPAPVASPAPISPLLTQPADYSKPESQAEIDAYNALGKQAVANGNYSQFDSIGANDERNVAGPTWTPGALENPAYVSAQLGGKDTTGIQQWQTPQEAAATAPSGIIAQQRQKTSATVSPNQITNGAQPASAADINADFSADFGRPAASTGLQFYQDALAADPNMTAQQLNEEILSGAQSQDKLAAASLNGGGSTAANWTNPLLDPSHVQSSTTNPTGNEVWNAATNSWTVPSGVNFTPTTNPNGAPTSAATYTPQVLGQASQVNVSPQQTVAGQLSNLENPNSPLIQAARTQALQQANASGLLNSSMAITAGDAAAYSAALPVATADASTYNNDAVTNAAANNQFSVANQNAINSSDQFNAGAQNTLTGQKMNQAMSAASTSQQAGSIYSNWINQIQQSTMDPGAKNDAEVQAYNIYLQQMQALAASGLPDVSGLLSFNGEDPSTGLPDYKDPNTGLYSSSSNSPNGTPAPTPTPTPTPTGGPGPVPRINGNQA